jgi:hypothetical protein
VTRHQVEHVRTLGGDLDPDLAGSGARARPSSSTKRPRRVTVSPARRQAPSISSSRSMRSLASPTGRPKRIDQVIADRSEEAQALRRNPVGRCDGLRERAAFQ